MNLMSVPSTVFLKSLTDEKLKEFLMSILAKRGGAASILFKYADIGTFADRIFS